MTGSAVDDEERPSSTGPARAADLLAQAGKALAERCPFDADEELARAPTLPAALSNFLYKHSDGRKKHRKAAHAEPPAAAGSPPPPLPSSSKVNNSNKVWDATEEFFRPVTMADIDALAPKVSFFSSLDSCFSIPIIGHLVEEENVKKDGNVSEEATVKQEATVEKEVEKAEVAVVEEEQRQQTMEIDSVPTCSGSQLAVEEFNEEEESLSSSLNWLLGSRQRAILTTERPSKKRKLLGGDAGLEQLIKLPISQECGDVPLCDMCCTGDRNVKSDRIVTCGSCSASVHQRCYGTPEGKDGSWVCTWCKNVELEGRRSKSEGKDSPASRPCSLCPKEGGALKPAGGGGEDNEERKFAHLFCSLWTPEVYVEDTVAMEPVMNTNGVQGMRTKLVCCLCKMKHGVCVRCSHGTCRTAFHPICAREAKHQMEVWGKFGFDNVELRAFCAKHSTVQDIHSAEHRKNLARVPADDSSVSKSVPNTLVRKKLPKLRLSRKDKDNSTAQAEMMCSVSNGGMKDETDLEQDSSTLRHSPQSGHTQSKENINVGVIERVNSLPNTCDLILCFKKLIDRGKINVGDAASEIGISPDSLEASLMGETSSFPMELRLKIIKWLQDSIHMPDSMRHLKIRNGSAISSGIDGPNSASITVPNVTGGVNTADPDNADACTKPLPPRRKKKNNKRNLNEDTTLCSFREKLQQSCNGKLSDEIVEVPTIQPECINGDTTRNLSLVNGQACCREEEVLLGKTLEDTFSVPGSNPSVDLPQRTKGNSAKLGLNDIPEAQPQLQGKVENVLPSRPSNDQDDEANPTEGEAAKDDRWVSSNDADAVVSATPDLNIGGLHYSSYVHPFIQKRLMEIQNNLLCKRKSREVSSNGHCGDGKLSTASACESSSNHESVPYASADMDHMLDTKELDQLDKAKSMGILEHSPEDELDGEILYLQNKLLDNAVAIKHSSEDLICRIVRELPRELDAQKKRIWDLVLVNQFLREVREAKKRGRKERKHREAQAILAAAAAAAAASSRNSLLRKDANDEISCHQESPLKISAASGRVTVNSPSATRLKETVSKSGVKVSPEKHSGILQRVEFGKENALSCEICWRSETVWKPVFVCSGCKVSVHVDCYRRLKDPIGSWKCELCEEMSSPRTSPRSQTVESKDTSCSVAQCRLCGGGTGAFRKTTDGHWVHAFCAEWLLESSFRRGQKDLVDGMDAIAKERDLLTCCICHHKIGVCLKCSYGHCQSAFHPSCARIAGFFMNVKAIGGRFQHKAYCEKHGLEQRQKADSQQYGAEELKSMKQMRVELEKLRLLCERIVKREKLKRDLALCSHDILASRRDYVAFSVLMRSPFFPPGVSSESATTSIDNRSYSGTIQRSDDITVDSTVSGKRRVRLSLDTNKRTDDSSTSQQSLKRKTADRTTFSGKQLPQRPGYIPVQNLANDGEKRFKARKATVTSHKECMMTSHEASMKNKLLPKGFAYVPASFHSKEKPVIDDTESHESLEPGG